MQRKKHSAEFKAKIALEAAKGLKTINEIAGEAEVHPTQVTLWKKQLLDEMPSLFASSRGKQEKKEEDLTAALAVQLFILTFILFCLDNGERFRIPNRIGIEHRPKVADLKTEVGYWESDTVIGKNHTGIVVTHVDKASKYLLAGLAKNKTMEEINRVTLKLFESVKPDFRKTMTFDNGREFCGHERLSESLQIKTFFANPYHSWERGLNEHTNGLIREFYPKSTNFKIVKEEDFQKAVDFINHRPRKSLDYRTPYEVFFASSEPVAFHP